MRVDIKGPIVSDSVERIYNWLGIPCTTPQRIRSELKEAGGEDIELYINSAGGHVTDASEIYTELREYKGKITAKITGLAASAASWASTAADEILMSPTGLYMVHNSWLSAQGDYADMENASDLLSQTDEAIRSAYKVKTGLSDEKLKEIMDETTWMNSTRAKELGFIDGVMFDEISSPEEVVNSLIPPSGLVNIANLVGQNDERSTKVGANKKPNEVVDNKTETVNEGKEITVENLKNDYSEIYKEIFNLGVNTERERIKDIENLGIVGNEELVNKAKFQEPKNAEKLAMEIVMAQKTFNTAMLNDMADDKGDLTVDSTASPGMVSNEEKTEETAKMIANMMNEGRK